jgi:tetratricopeptide (TPR) repeat protein
MTRRDSTHLGVKWLFPDSLFAFGSSLAAREMGTKSIRVFKRDLRLSRILPTSQCLEGFSEQRIAKSEERKVWSCERTLTVACLLLVSLLPSRAQQSQPTVRHHTVQETTNETAPEIEQAEAAIQKGEYPAAQALLEMYVANKPDDYLAWFDLGYVYKATNQTNKAIDAYRKSIAAKGDVFESNLNLGILLAREGNSAEAAKYLKTATQLKPTAHVDEGLARAWQSLGIVLSATADDQQQALDAFAKAAQLEPNNPEPHMSAGQLLEKQNKLDAAAKEYEAAATRDPKSIEPLVALSGVYTKQQKYPQAEEILRKMLANDPKNGVVRTQLGRILAAEGKTDEAANELGAGTGKPPDDPHAALELGTLYVHAGKYAEAEQMFRSAAQKLPQDAEVHYALGSALMQEKKYPEAQQELWMAVKLKPNLGEAYGNLAVVAAENKNYQLAIRALDARAQLLPESPATFFLRATSFDNLKAVPQAVDYYKKFLAADAGQQSDMEWQARHRLIALDPGNAKKYEPSK